jgi:uncharacterized protein
MNVIFSLSKFFIMEVLTRQIEKVKGMYESFNKGDIPSLMSKLDKECIWESMGQPDIPYAGIYHGPDDIKIFFKELEEHIQFNEMIPEHFTEVENLVIVTGHLKGKVLKNKKLVSSIWAMTFEFNHAGKVTHFRDIFDTLTLGKAFAK